MSEHLTRRSLVKATPVAVIAASVPALAGAHADAELLALRPEWIATRARFEDALNALNEAETRFNLCRPTFPDFHTFAGSYTDFKAEHDRIRVIYDALEIETGVVAAHQIEDQTSDADSEMVDRIVALPARTREGVRFKQEVLRDWEHCQRDDLEQSIMEDLLAMVGGLDA